MLLKKVCAIFSAVLVGFSCSLLPAVISPSFAADTDQYYMDLFFAPPSIDPIMKSDQCHVNSRQSVLAYAWTPKTTFASSRIKVVSSSFEPVDHVRYLYVTYGIRSTVNGSVLFSSGGNYNVGLTYHKNYTTDEYTDSSAVTFIGSQAQYNTNARIITVKIAIPAQASSFSFHPTWGWDGTSDTATYGIYCESAYIVDATEDISALIDQILTQCIDMNAELDTQTSLLRSISTKITSINNKVTNIYGLLSTALADETTVLDNKSQQVADQIMQQDNAEQYWNDKNQENFNALDLNNFSFSSGVVSALGTVGNLFTSIWNSLGDTVLIFTFPLMLGITLVAIGRVSRHGGKGKDDKGGVSD
mgnify:CR=1 FL=1